jgi:hypothetical protein
MKKIQTSLTRKDWVGISLFGLIASLGFFASLFGFIADFLNVPTADNWIKTMESSIQEFLTVSLTLLQGGAILLITGVFFLVIILNSIAQREQVEREKKLRRAQRLQDVSES